MKIYLFVALGGALGAMARYAVVVAMGKVAGLNFPWGTLSVNLLGSLGLGLLTGALISHLHLSLEMRALVVAGFFGAFTTFSTFSLDIVFLAERHQYGPAAAYAIGSLVVGSALFLGGLRFWRLFA